MEFKFEKTPPRKKPPSSKPLPPDSPESESSEIDSEDEGALWERAEAHHDSKKLGDAMGDIHKLLALNPGNQKARKFKAQILEKLDTKERD